MCVLIGSYDISVMLGGLLGSFFCGCGWWHGIPQLFVRNYQDETAFCRRVVRMLGWGLGDASGLRKGRRDKRSRATMGDDCEEN
jgi:hypothetical protein